MAARVMPFSDHPKIVHTSVVAASMHHTYGQSRRTYAQNLPSDMVGIVLRLLLTKSVHIDPQPTRVIAPRSGGGVEIAQSSGKARAVSPSR